MKRDIVPLHHGYKTLLEALEAAEVSSTQTKKYLKDKRLSITEKKFITYLTQLRNNDFSFIDELAHSRADGIPFLKGIKHLILGALYVYKADSVEAEKHLKLAMPYIHESQNETFIKRMIFRIHSNLFYTYVNQKRFLDLKRQFEITRKLEKTDSDAISFLIMTVCYYSMTGCYPEAEDTLMELKTFKNKFTDIQIISYYIEKFDLFVKLGLLNKAATTLQQMKKHRAFRLTSFYHYCNKLLRFLMKDEKIYLHDRDFTAGNDDYTMIKVISALAEENESEAREHWSKLAQISPETFQEDFKFNGDQCLFSLSLEKCLSKSNKKKIKLHETYTEYELALINCFQKADFSPLSKEELFLKVYGKELSSKEDLAALAMLVYRINKKGELLLKSRKGTFYLAHEGQSKLVS